MNKSYQIKRSVSCDSAKEQSESYCSDPFSSDVVQPSDDDEDMVQKEKPKRPLSAYNIFFRYERSRLLCNIDNGKIVIQRKEDGTIDLNYTEEGHHLKPKLCMEDVRHQLEMIDDSVQSTKRPHRKGHGKIGFTELIRYIGKTWSSLDDESREVFEILATEKRDNYKKSMRQYKVATRKAARKQRKTKKTHKYKALKHDLLNKKEELQLKDLPDSMKIPNLQMQITPSNENSHNNVMHQHEYFQFLYRQDITRKMYPSSFDNWTHFYTVSRKNETLDNLMEHNAGHERGKSLINEEDRDLAEFLLLFSFYFDFFYYHEDSVYDSIHFQNSSCINTIFSVHFLFHCKVSLMN